LKIEKAPFASPIASKLGYTSFKEVI